MANSWVAQFSITLPYMHDNTKSSTTLRNIDIYVYYIYIHTFFTFGFKMTLVYYLRTEDKVYFLFSGIINKMTFVYNL